MIGTVITALQAQHGTLGVHAPERWGSTIEQTPQVRTIPARGRWDQNTIGERKHQKRRFRIQVVVGEVGPGDNEIINEAIRLLGVFGNHYLTVVEVPTDDPTVEVVMGNADGLTDTGLSILTVGKNTDYHGFEFVIEVDMYWG